jgi:NAD/NADP transhydrogenase alpha subunit
MTVGVPKESAAGERRVALVGRGEVRYDVRPEVAEQVASLGAKWLDVGVITEELNGI